MPLYRQNIDSYWSQDGDYHFDNGDLRDTTVEQYRGAVQQIISRLMSSRGDWAIHPDLGADISSFLGRPNTRETAEEMRRGILGELVREGMVSSRDIVIDIVPIARHSVMILIRFLPPDSTKAINIAFTYNLSENKLTSRNVK